MENNTQEQETGALSPGQFGYTPPVPSAPITDTAANQNVNGSNFPLPANLNTVNASQVGGAPVNTPSVTPNTSGDGLSAYVGTTSDSIKSQMDKTNENLQNQVNTEEGNDQTYGKNLSTIYNELAGIPQETQAIYAKNGVDAAEQNVNSLNTAINSEKVATAAQIQNIKANNPTGMDAAGVNGTVQRLQNDSSYRLANLGIALSAASGNWTAAQNISDRQVAALTQPLQTALDATKEFYETNKTSLNAKESQLYTNKIDQLNTALKVATDAGVTLQAAKNDAMKTAITMGASSDEIMKIQSAKNYDELGTAAGAINGTTSGTGTGAGSAATNIASALGMKDTSQPLVNVLSQFGTDAVVDQIIKNENSQLNSKYNNPGDIKFNNLPGQKDSGVTASDGGTFASYATPAAGKAAVASMVANIASNTAGTSYAQTPSAQNGGKISFQDFINKYTNTAPASYGQYGLLTNTDFNPNLKPDQNANSYLQAYLKNASVPTPSQLGISTRSGVGQSAFSKAQTRAGDLYYQATGTSLPSPAIIKSNLGLISSNNKLLNNLDVQTGTVKQNFDLAMQTLAKSGLDQNNMPINSFINYIQETLAANPDAAAYIAQNTTLQNELGSLLAVKNASGTTVYDKLSSAGLIPKNASVDQQKAAVTKLLQEAQNAKSVIGGLNGDLYKVVDPLQQDASNPNRNTSGGTSAQNLAQQKGFNYQAAIKSGYNDAQILAYLNSQ